MYMHIYMYIYVSIHVSIYIYIHMIRFAAFENHADRMPRESMVVTPRYLALPPYCHYQFRMMYGIQKGSRGGVVYRAIDVQW